MTGESSNENKDVSPTDKGFEGEVFEEDADGWDVLWQAVNSHMRGDVEAGRSVLRLAEDSHIKGHVEAESVLLDGKNSYIKGDVEAEKDVLMRAQNSHIRGDVESENGGTVLNQAENSYAEGNVQGRNVLEEAENSHVEGNVEAEGNILTVAHNSYVEGNVTSKSVLLNGENSHVIGDVEAENGGTVLNQAENSHIVGNVEAEENVLEEAQNSHIEGDVKGEDVLWGAENSYVEGDLEVGVWGIVLGKAENSYIEGDVRAGIKAEMLWQAENSYAVSDKIDVATLGLEAKGGLVASKEINVDESIGENITVISGEEVPGTVKYEGDWEKLSDFLYKEIKKEDFGKLKPLELFTIEKSSDLVTSMDKTSDSSMSLDDFKQELEELNFIYQEVEEEYGIYKEFEGTLHLEDIWSKSNQERIEYLESFDQTVKDKISRKLDVGEEEAGKVLDSKNSIDLVSELDGWYSEVNLEKFIETHYEGVGDSYEREYILETGDVATEENLEEINEKLYEEGFEILEGVREGVVGFDIDQSLDSYKEIQKLEEKRSEVDQEAGQLFKNSKEGEAEEKIKEKEKLGERINKKRREVVSEAIGDMIDDPYSPSMNSLKRCLNQLSQNYLGGKTRQNAKNISDNLMVKEENLESDSALKFNRWRKNISDIPTNEETKCCAMLGFGNGDVFDYMKSESVDIFEFEAGGKYGIGVTAYGENENGNKVMLVDSVESGSNILNRKDVSRSVSEAVENFARYKDCEEVVYYGNPFNNASNQFYQNLKENKYEEVNGKSIDIESAKDLHIEADLDDLGGKRIGLD